MGSYKKLITGLLSSAITIIAYSTLADTAESLTIINNTTYNLNIQASGPYNATLDTVLLNTFYLKPGYPAENASFSWLAPNPGTSPRSCGFTINLENVYIDAKHHGSIITPIGRLTDIGDTDMYGIACQNQAINYISNSTYGHLYPLIEQSTDHNGSAVINLMCPSTGCTHPDPSH